MTTKCQICGTEYKYCPECNKIDSYKKVADRPDCYKIYLIIYEYRTNVIDKSKAKEEFKTIGITEKTLSNFGMVDSVHDYVLEIIKEEKVSDNAIDVEEITSTKKNTKKDK